MTKATEIATLKGFTERLPHDSYLRPWLESILPEVEADIRNDFPVSPSPQAGRAEAARIITEARTEAVSLVAVAKELAKTIRETAITDAKTVRDNLRYKIQTIANEL
jgi:hypothetical protein